MRANISKNSLVLIWFTSNCHECVILRGGADQRWTTDVDVLNRFLERDIRIGHRLLERVQVHDYQFEGHNTLLRDCRYVIGAVAAAEDAAVDFWVEGLNPAIHHLGEA